MESFNNEYYKWYSVQIQMVFQFYCFAFNLKKLLPTVSNVSFHYLYVIISNIIFLIEWNCGTSSV